ncbi:Y-family DNA polymerase [Paralcaligenes ureilyticus]|uniref:Protein ImuB n=1 Tax=Paralcaligenes ureilyticus TaxID=627131 RepID=A0A4R3MB98_9BURK|nr:DNA polymerase Y family protein [Paralcaligenes ureilyticus]TCT10412.1 protein ImuB [Paralcaligenes ureilyticus]
MPTHSLDAIFPHWPTDTPLAAILLREKVYASTPAAQALGLQTGMRLSTVLALAPGIALRDADPGAECQYLQQIALSLLQYTPCLAFFDAHTLVLEVSASLRLFQGPRGLWRRLTGTLNTLSVQARMGMAPSACGATLLAWQTQSRQRRVLQASSLRRRLDPLAVSLLPASKAYTQWLQGIGCRSLAQLRQLPRKGLQQRSEPALVHGLDAAYGTIDEYFQWFEAPTHFGLRHELSHHIEHAQAVHHAAARLIEPLCGWLQTKHAAVSTLCFKLHHEKGRHAQAPTELILKLSQAAWQPDDFLTVLGEQLRTLTLNAPVIAIELNAATIEPRPGLSQSLFLEPAQWASHERHLLDLLCARLGTACVLHAQPNADYRPEQANRWVPALGSPSPGASGRAKRATPGQARLATRCTLPNMPSQTRPFWLLSAPLALQTHNNRPIYQGASLRLIQGPERIETGWWSQSAHEARDYFIAQDPGYARYWIYREREVLQAHWFLHGLFA